MSDDRLRMTPGPTEVPAAVRERMAEPMPNPDVESAFVERYRALTDALETVYLAGADGAPADADRDVAVLGGEGIHGLEAPLAALVEDADPVLSL